MALIEEATYGKGHLNDRGMSPYDVDGYIDQKRDCDNHSVYLWAEVNQLYSLDDETPNEGFSFAWSMIPGHSITSCLLDDGRIITWNYWHREDFKLSKIFNLKAI